MDGLPEPRGFTLLQLITVLSITSILTSMALPGFHHLVQGQQAYSAIYTLQSLFQFTRYTAMSTNTPLSLCALDAAGKCTRLWDSEHTVAVFDDENRNNRLDEDEGILRQLDWTSFSGRIRWGASLARTYIRFETSGNTWQNGTLYYCPLNRSTRYARALVLSHSGRSYLTGDSDNNGIHENRAGEELVCDW